jgi:hypothetical protein
MLKSISLFSYTIQNWQMHHFSFRQIGLVPFLVRLLLESECCFDQSKQFISYIWNRVKGIKIPPIQLIRHSFRNIRQKQTSLNLLWSYNLHNFRDLQLFLKSLLLFSKGTWIWENTKWRHYHKRQGINVSLIRNWFTQIKLIEIKINIRNISSSNTVNWNSNPSVLSLTQNHWGNPIASTYTHADRYCHGFHFFSLSSNLSLL